MDLDMYVTEYWLKERIGEMRAAAMREQLVQSLRTRRPLRVALGLALVWLGQRLQGGYPRTPNALAPGGRAA